MNLNRAETYICMKSIIDSISKEVEEIKSLKELGSEENIKFKRLVNYIENEIAKCKVSIEELNKPFLMFVVGNGNYGKSTLINTLLKTEVIETTDLPNTWKLDLFRLDEEEKMEIIYNNNSKKTYKLKKGNKILFHEEKKYNDSKKKISSLLKEYRKKDNYTKEKLLKLKKQLDDEYIYKSDIIEVHYYLKYIDILRDFIIVDTPGLNQKLLRSTKASMEYYYNRADGIIWLIDAQNIVSKKSSDLIREINGLDSLYGKNKNIIGVVNKMDIILQQGSENVEKVKEKVREIYKEYFNDIVFISAKKGLDGLINNNNTDICESNINSLYYAIDKNFKLKSEEKQIKSKNTNMKIMRDKIIKEIESYRRELYEDISKYNESAYQLKNKSQSFRKYILESLNELYNNNYSNNNSPVKSIIDDITAIEQMCNKSLNKIFNNLLITSNISSRIVVSKINLNISLCKSKYLILSRVTNPKTNHINNGLNENRSLINNLPVRNSKDYLSERYMTKFNTIKEIEGIINEIMFELDEKIYEINHELNNLRESSFKDYHLSYDKYKEFINKIDNIENILYKMG